jgi:hypothetical protein
MRHVAFLSLAEIDDPIRGMSLAYAKTLSDQVHLLDAAVKPTLQIGTKPITLTE